MRDCLRQCDSLQILYVDIDTLFLDDPRGWWEEFEDMNARGALFGAAAEGGTWYSSNAPEGMPSPLRLLGLLGFFPMHCRNLAS